MYIQRVQAHGRKRMKRKIRLWLLSTCRWSLILIWGPLLVAAFVTGLVSVVLSEVAAMISPKFIVNWI